MSSLICDVSGFLVKDLKDFILCLESASAYHELTTYCDTPLTVYNLRNDLSIKTAHLMQYPKPGDVDYIEDCEQIREGFWVTSRERTICELIKYKREEFFIYEAIEEYNNDFEVLGVYAKKYGVEKELDEFLHFANKI